MRYFAAFSLFESQILHEKSKNAEETMKQHLTKEERQARNERREFSLCYRFPPPDPDDVDYIRHRLEGMVDWLHNQRTIDGKVKASIVYGRRKVPIGIHVRIRALGSKQNALSLAQIMLPLSRRLERLMQYQGGERSKANFAIDDPDSKIDPYLQHQAHALARGPNLEDGVKII